MAVVVQAWVVSVEVAVVSAWLALLVLSVGAQLAAAPDDRSRLAAVRQYPAPTDT